MINDRVKHERTLNIDQLTWLNWMNRVKKRTIKEKKELVFFVCIVLFYFFCQNNFFAVVISHFWSNMDIIEIMPKKKNVCCEKKSDRCGLEGIRFAIITLFKIINGGNHLYRSSVLINMYSIDCGNKLLFK